MRMTMSGNLEPMAGQKQTETYHGNGIRLDIEFGAVIVATFTGENEICDRGSPLQKENKVWTGHR